MENIPGGDLFDAINDAADDEDGPGQLDQQICCKWLHNITTGLDYLHKMGVVHRDIKPENVLLTSTDRPNAVAKLADYGASTFITKKKAIHDRIHRNPFLHGPRNLIGTEIYQRS